MRARGDVRRILSGYVAARHVARVRYVVSDKRVRGLIESEIKALRAHELIDIEECAPSIANERVA